MIDPKRRGRSTSHLEYYSAPSLAAMRSRTTHRQAGSFMMHMTPTTCCVYVCFTRRMMPSNHLLPTVVLNVRRPTCQSIELAKSTTCEACEAFEAYEAYEAFFGHQHPIRRADMDEISHRRRLQYISIRRTFAQQPPSRISCSA